MKYILSVFLFFTCTIVFAQAETAQFQGKTYFVYPHQSTLMESQASTFRLFAKKQEVLKRDENNRNVVGKTIEPVSERYQEYVKKEKSIRGLLGLLDKLVREKPNEIYAFENVLSGELVPSLEKIPDGEYVQFYKDVPFLDNETLRYRNDIVSARFSVKDGAPDGPIVYYNTLGKEIAWGNYAAGSRVGNWRASVVKIEYGRGATLDIKSYDQLMSRRSEDTLSENIAYRDGLKNGPYTRMVNRDTLASGFFLNDAEAGTWRRWQYQVLAKGPGKYELTSRLVPESVYTIAEKPVAGKSVIFREEFILAEELENYFPAYEETAGTTKKYKGPDALYYPSLERFSEFYRINRQEEEDDIEMPEENFNSFEGEAFNMEAYENFSVAPDENRNELIDSLGYLFDYTGVFERYYLNGQLQFRFEIKDGVLQKEEPMYWDNGKIANEVVFVPDSNRCEVRFYDYTGELYATQLYDREGNALEEAFEIYGLDEYDETTLVPPGYNALNTLETIARHEVLKGELTGPVTLVEKKWYFDQQQAYLETYDPAAKKLDVTVTALSGNVVNRSEISFSEDFRSINGYEEFYLGGLKLRSQLNGSRSEFAFSDLDEADSAKSDEEKYVGNWSLNYDTDYDDVLYLNDQPFSGTYEIRLEEKSYRMKTGASSVSFSIPAYDAKLLSRASKKYWKKGKQQPVLDFVNSEVREDAFYTMIFRFTRFAEYGILSTAPENEYEGLDFDPSFEAKFPRVKTISGLMVNGKPDGKWTGKDQNGKVMVEISYVNGEENGELKTYATDFAPTRREKEFAARYGEDYYSGSRFTPERPAKDTRYVYETAVFKNGMLNGPRMRFNWKGDTLSYVFYRDGSMEGPAFEKNNVIQAYSRYENDALDGVVRTWLTLPGKSPVLLYDLNFQNGTLQGESKTYHANGKLAKRGFFLYGQPIDDYEAFDSLGFRYQYVKFRYNQPVEEKIWEENQLSLRYEFDWRDSIAFNLSDIAESPTIEDLMLELGMLGDEYYEPYLGRPSLVDKTGIDYYMTKYYPNDSIAREGFISDGKKSACWKYYGYDGKLLYEVDYADTLIVISDSVKFKSKGVLSFYDGNGGATSHSYIIEKFEKYDCSHTDHYEERMLYCFWEKDTAVHRRDGYVVNYYDNGSKMCEGTVVNGLPHGVWKMYDNSGNLNKVGEYRLGKRQGRWLTGDLTNVKFLGDICLNPNLPNLDEIMKYQEKLIDIRVIYYQNGKSLREEYYGINMNSGEAPQVGMGEYYGE